MLTGLDLLQHVRSVPEVIRYHSRNTPDREAVIFGDRRFNYAELDRQVERFARALVASGVENGDRVAMLATPRPEFLFAMLGCMRVGAMWVGLNPRYRLPELVYVLSNCRPQVLISISVDGAGRTFDEELRAISRQPWAPREIVSLGASLAGVSVSADEFLVRAEDVRDEVYQSREASIERHTPAVIVYTSGSSGRPKGAILSHGSFFHSYRALAESFGSHEELLAGQRVICNLPISHVGCQADICTNALIDAGTIVFMETFDPAGVLETIDRERINRLGALPLMHQQVFDSPAVGKHDLNSLKVILWGGAAMPRPLIERLRARGYFLSMHYGLTEGGSVCSVSHADSGMDVFAATIGWPDHDNEYRVVTSAGTTAAEGEVGEVQIRGPGVMLGYFGDVEATKAIFTPDGWLRTNDLVEIRSDGAWRFVGRLTEMFKSGGYNVYPREIELALEEHPDVAAVAIVAVPDTVYDEVGWAFVVAQPSAELTPEQLVEFARHGLANYKVPKRFLVRKYLPLLPVGKIDKLRLKSEALEILKKEGGEQSDHGAGPFRRRGPVGRPE
jgi:acyl-CoA synthetase (AMP-forming)/AMP-acid ligase II